MEGPRGSCRRTRRSRFPTTRWAGSTTGSLVPGRPERGGAANACYDRIGFGYAVTRREDPRIAAAIRSALGAASSVLNVGAGAGSYEPRDRRVVAVEPSARMLGQRARTAAPAVRAVAERLPFPAATFDAVLCVLTVHHWADPEAGLRECRRVACDRVVVFTWDGSVGNGYAHWIEEYFPDAMAGARRLSSPISRLGDALGPLEVRPFPLPRDCSDLFGGALWGRPELLLDPSVRGGVSSLATLGEPAIRPGLERLQRDVASGAWDARHGRLRALPSLDLGYVIVVARLRPVAGRIGRARALAPEDPCQQ